MVNLEAIRYYETVNLPKLKASIDRLVDRQDYYDLFTEYHVPSIEKLLALVERACEEGNGILIRPEYGGYYVLVWNER